MSSENGFVGGVGRAKTPLLGWTAVFVMAVLATATVWDPAHDEGVTWTQVLGPVVVPDCASRGPVPMGDLFEALEGRRDHGLREVVRALRSDGMHPPAYYGLLHGWVFAFGIERYVMVLPAIFWGFLALLAMGRVGERMAPGRGSRGLAMALLATSPWFVGYSVFARPYGLAVAIALGATWAVLEIGTGPVASRRQRIGRWVFVALSILGLYTLYHYIFVVAWHMLALVHQIIASPQTRRRQWVSLGWMAGVIAVGFVPWWPILVSHLGRTADSGYYFAGVIPIADWPAQLANLFEILLLGQGLWSSWGSALVVAIALLGSITIPFAILACRPSALRTLDSPARSLWWAAPVLPLAILGSDLFRDTHTFFISKTSFGLLPLLLLLLVRAVVEFRNQFRGAWLMIAWPLLFSVATLGAIRENAIHATAYEVIVDVLARKAESAHLVFFSTGVRGYTVPFLLEARDRGLDEIGVAYAGRQDLQACLEAAMDSPGLEQVTLVDFAVPYRKDDYWGELPKRILASRKSATPWEAVTLDPSHPRMADGEGRAAWLRTLEEVRSTEKRLVLTIAPAKVNWFSE